MILWAIQIFNMRFIVCLSMLFVLSEMLGIFTEL
jgi:hypothetical protein